MVLLVLLGLPGPSNMECLVEAVVLCGVDVWDELHVAPNGVSGLVGLVP